MNKNFRGECINILGSYLCLPEVVHFLNDQTKKKEHAKIVSVCIHFLFIQNIAASISFMSSMRVDKKFTSPVIQDAKLHEISNAVYIYDRGL